MDRDGSVVGALQCKYSYSGDPIGLGAELRDRLEKHWDVEAHVYVATLFRDHEPQADEDRVTYLGPTRLSAMLMEHWEQVPAAQRLDLDRKPA